MNILHAPLQILRIVAGMLFVALAGVLTLVATGIGRLGWTLAGDRPAQQYVRDAESGIGMAAPAV
jgi:hypothetical protein